MMFEQGTRYEIVYETQGANYRWKRQRFVGTFLGASYQGQQFDLRPDAGTATLPSDARIISATVTTRAHHGAVSA
jgi:hypothetical protein